MHPFSKFSNTLLFNLRPNCIVTKKSGAWISTINDGLSSVFSNVFFRQARARLFLFVGARIFSVKYFRGGWNKKNKINFFPMIFHGLKKQERMYGDRREIPFRTVNGNLFNK